MNEYETVYILKPDLPSARVQKVAEKVQKILSDHQAELLGTQDWGKRKLAYRVGSFHFGHYVYFNYTGNGQFIGELERQLKYEEEVIRFLTVKVGLYAQAEKRSKRPSQLEEARLGAFNEFGGSDREEREEPEEQNNEV